MDYSRLNIVLHTDEAFSMQACTLMLSVCENNKFFAAIVFYVLDTGISQESKEKMSAMLSFYKRDIYFIDTQEIIDSLVELGITPYQGINMGVYLKGMLNRFVPETLERIIYIDCDAVVDGSLEEVWRTDFGDKAIAMAADCMNKRIKEGYGFDGQYYYNTGVMLINLINWGKNNCEKKYFDYILGNVDKKYEWADQDLINASLGDDSIKISPKYNWISLYEIYNYRELGKIYGLNDTNYYTREQFEEAQSQPVIYHFPSVFIGRPWYKGEYLQNSEIFDKYLYSPHNPWNKYVKDVRSYPVYTKIQRRMYTIFPKAVFVSIHRVASILFSHKITSR